MDILLSQCKASAITNSALLHPNAVCTHDNSFLFRSQSKADSVLKDLSSSAHNVYFSIKTFQPSDLLAQERTINYHNETLQPKTWATFKIRHYLKELFEIYRF